MQGSLNRKETMPGPGNVANLPRASGEVNLIGEPTNATLVNNNDA